ncbi:hypothetical protein DQQ10_09250 [Pseudochryseolinea flava]|uniref:Tetratricopeptide repeat protein n=2 Tax=Pseudochryseolinea flava TaxID=2059302 RepID=A0A364Y4Y9_9BACT|nr:hypothetical protein DQQ10_09250 [Pseudochryseolinea flava]
MSCTGKKDDQSIRNDLAAIELSRGDITLCGVGKDQFGSVSFTSACSEDVRDNFNLALALLHSFEYTEAEKMFAKVVDQDPSCAMGYWGIAMCNFHPLWSPPTQADLQKGAKVIKLGRAVVDESSAASDYLEAIAVIYDHADSIDHRVRLSKFEKASERIFDKYPDDAEAAIFYALALDAAVDPTDKSFKNQRKAGAILNKLFEEKPNHPGVAHYLIHNYDYPELAEEGLPAARKYASIAAASAHAQHMPSHIFTRLGLWDESIESNIKSVDAARCYAEKSGLKAHWDEELHGLDYLIYAYLQKGDDAKALEQLKYLNSIQTVSPVNFKAAYSLAAGSARYALERRDWSSAAALTVTPAGFPWDKFLWEQANIHFAKALGAVHINKIADAKKDLQKLEALLAKLQEQNETYKANLVSIQVKAAGAWIKFKENKKSEAIAMMNEASFMEDATAKHPVTPGEVLPARELLGDMYMAISDPKSALKEYEASLRTHPNRFNGLYGALVASRSINDIEKLAYYKQKLAANNFLGDRPQMEIFKEIPIKM